MATLLGPDGRPIRRADLTREIALPTTTGVRQVLSAHPARGLTPGRLVGLLQDAEQGDATAYLELAEDMEERDLHYAAVLGTRKRAVAQLEITVEAASDAAEDERNAELVRKFLARDELEDELFDILDALGKGLSVTEIVWETSERQWMPVRLEWRDPRWFQLDRDDGRTVRLREDAGDIDLPAWKFIRHLPKVKSGLPIRGGLARAAAWSWLFKSYAIKDWVQFAETFGQPIRIGKFHAGATREEKETLLRAVASLGTDAGAIIPDTMQLELIEAERGSSSDVYERLCDWLDRQVSKAVLGQTLTTEVKGGSLAAARVHDAVREDIERADCKQLAATLNRDLVRPIIDLNHGPQAWYPRLRIGRPESADTAELSQALERLVPLGLRVRQAEVRRKLGLEEPDDDDELLAPSAAPPPAPPALPPAEPGEDVEEDEPDDDEVEALAAGLCPIHGAHAAGRPAALDNADVLAARLEEAAAGAMDAIGDEVGRLVDSAASLDELARRLIELHRDVDVGVLADRLREALVLADLVGRAETLPPES